MGAEAKIRGVIPQPEPAVTADMEEAPGDYHIIKPVGPTRALSLNTVVGADYISQVPIGNIVADGNVQIETEADGIKQMNLLKVFDEGFPKIQNTVSQLYHGLDGDSPVSIASLWKWLSLPSPGLTNTSSMSVKLPHIVSMTQQGLADCVGAVAASVITTIADTPITPEFYQDFLSLALKHRLAVRDNSGIKVNPSVLNILTTPDYTSLFPSPAVTISYKRGLSLTDISQVVRDLSKKKNCYDLYVLCPVSSWKNVGGGHLIAMQEIDQDNVTVYDPNEPSNRVLSQDEFGRHWQYSHNSSIFIFCKK